MRAPGDARMISTYLDLDPSAGLATKTARRTAVTSLVDQARRMATAHEDGLSHAARMQLRADVARIVWAVKEPTEGDEMRMAFVFSGGEEPGAMIVYGTSAAAFDRTRPLLEASAQATRGVVPTPRSQRLFYKALPFLQITGVVGLLTVLLLSRRRSPGRTPARASATTATTAPAADESKDAHDAPADHDER